MPFEKNGVFISRDIITTFRCKVMFLASFVRTFTGFAKIGVCGNIIVHVCSVAKGDVSMHPLEMQMKSSVSLERKGAGAIS